ncbi:flagellar basal body P-ring protein FlgI [bacterium AH-315-J21]|nr:flagellar basal body P-ring protein FlgI [bacterium AH-315-J21]
MVMCAVLLLHSSLYASVRIKDIVSIKNQQSVDLIGYGLIIGLDGTGDGKKATFTAQSLANMIERMGLTVNANIIKVKNVASVIVTARVSNTTKPGTLVDVTVSSIGDAKSLQGGTLLMTPLSDITGKTYGVAQGPVSIGGFNVQVDDGNRIVNNYTLVGRVPNGGRITAKLPQPIEGVETAKQIELTLNAPDFTTSSRVAQKINIVYGEIAYPLDDANIKIDLPDSLRSPIERIKFISTIGQLKVNPDVAARVVINEKTGTIVAGEHVSIAPVAIAHGTITINISVTPVISQPEAFSLGETVVTSESQITVQDETARVMFMDEAVSIADVAQALNTIGAAPRDIIAIFQALKQAGALRAELIIL